MFWPSHPLFLPFLAVQHYTYIPKCSVQKSSSGCVFPQLSCPAVLSRMSCPICPVSDALSWLSCPGYKATMIEERNKTRSLDATTCGILVNINSKFFLLSVTFCQLLLQTTKINLLYCNKEKFRFNSSFSVTVITLSYLFRYCIVLHHCSEKISFLIVNALRTSEIVCFFWYLLLYCSHMGAINASSSYIYVTLLILEFSSL